MNVTRGMVVADSVSDDAADVRRCRVSQTPDFHVVVERLVYSSGGARRMRLWSCETHPLPENDLTVEVA